MKPQTSVTIKWGASTTKSGVLSAYELRYTTDDGVTYKTVSTSIDINTFEYTFTPEVKENQTLKIQICARNSYNKKSSYATFPDIQIYADGKSVEVIGSEFKDVRAFVKIDGEMKKIDNIKVKVNGNFYNIDQYPV